MDSLYKKGALVRFSMHSDHFGCYDGVATILAPRPDLSGDGHPPLYIVQTADGRILPAFEDELVPLRVQEVR